jgi:methylenetetrahydrofolate--tRNA-(uracil-5-)-methyltransferase
MADAVTSERVTVIGGGLAGSECAWQLARRGVPVTLREMKPVKRSPAHKLDCLAELVCSNSLRSDNPESAVGLLHQELRQLQSLILGCADAHRVPAGDALAVDREAFGAAVTGAVHGAVQVEAGEVEQLPAGPVVIATGPLTSDALTRELERYVGEKLYFYDSIAPIVSGDSIDLSIAFRQSRYGKGDGDDYLNLPMNREEYYAFVEAIKAGQKVVPHAFEEPRYFEGCLPIEVMAARGVDTLRFGPMKPVGLPDPRTGREPYAVVQLRQDNIAGDHFSLVGFQTQMKWGEQARVLKMIPGLENAEFVRFGMIHRNTYVNAPTVLRETWQTRMRDDLFFAGQMSGVEGYVESAASGLIAGRNAAALVLGEEPSAPPRTTALGALAYYASHADPKHYVPSNIAFGLMPPLDARVKSKKDRNIAISERALRDLDAWSEHISKPFSNTSA